MGRIVDIFAWTWNFWVGQTGNTSKQQEIAAFSEEILSENDFEAVLPFFCCYDYGANVSEAIEKIATDQTIITNVPCLLHNQNISITVKKVLLGQLRRSSKNCSLHRKSNNNWPLSSFIHSGNEIRIYKASSGLLLSLRNYLLHEGIMLTISKMFTFVFLLCLWE